MSDRGVPMPRQPQRFDRQGAVGCAGIRRLDLTVDLERPADHGRAILSGIAALEPRLPLKSVIHRGPRGIETVTWQGSSGKVARTYDKGIESGSHRPGERVRLEDQRRFGRGVRMQSAEVEAGYARALFERRFSMIWAAKKGLTVTTLGPAIAKVQEAVHAGDMTPASALKVIGYLVTEQRGVEVGSRSSRYRHRQAARELGLVLADGAVEEVEIDLAEQTAEISELRWG
jgi:hypothetical protein